MQSLITHRGVIKEINKGVAVLEVRRDAACGGCDLHGSCGMGTDDNMYLKFTDKDYSVGDILEVEIGRKDFYRSILFVYILPVVVMVFAAILVDSIQDKEIITAVSTLFAAVPYFLWLKLYMKDKGGNIQVKRRIPADKAANLSSKSCSK